MRHFTITIMISYLLSVRIICVTRAAACDASCIFKSLCPLPQLTESMSQPDSDITDST